MTNILLTPARIGPAEIPNRIVMPPMAISEPRRSLSSGQAARVSRTWAKNFSA